MDPDIPFYPCLPAVLDDLIGCLIALIVSFPYQKGSHIVRGSRKIVMAEPVDPVRDGLAGKRHAAPLEICLHAVGRQAQACFLVHELRYKGRTCQGTRKEFAAGIRACELMLQPD